MQEFLVWISISMPSHKSYFQVQWALSSAKLILHDIPWGPRWRFVIEGTMADTSMQVNAVKTNVLTIYFFLIIIIIFGISLTFLQSLKKFSRNTFLVVYSWSNIWAKNNATSSAAGPSFTFLPAHTRPSACNHQLQKSWDTIKPENPFFLSKFNCAQFKIPSAGTNEPVQMQNGPNRSRPLSNLLRQNKHFASVYWSGISKCSQFISFLFYKASASNFEDNQDWSQGVRSSSWKSNMLSTPA